eukprot:m.6451 g.6451  ORF g.6451 m.6451 type:complete len:337 (+) comp15924_c0_seq2:69-1079(+)
MSENSRSEEKSSIKKRAFQFFARAKQYTQEKIGSAEKTQYDVSFENLVLQANRTKEWTEKVVKGIEDILLPDSKFHFKDFFYDKLTVRGNKTVSRPTAATVFGQVLLDAGHDLGPESPFGSFLLQHGEVEKKIGAARAEFIQMVSTLVLSPLKAFLVEDMKVIQKEQKSLEAKRLDLDTCKNRAKKANSDKALMAEEELRAAQSEFDKQQEVTKLLLEKIPYSHASNAQHLQNLVEAERQYYEKCLRYAREAASKYPDCGASSSAVSVPYSENSEEDGSDLPEKAKVIYDFDASDETQLSVLANEVVTVSEKDEKWALVKRGEDAGKVPLTYLEFM